MYATDLEATSAKTSRASKLLASSQKPSHFSFSLFLFVTILVGVNDAKVNLRNGAFKIRGSTSYSPTQKKNRGNFHHRHGDQAVKWTRGQNRYNNNYQNAKVTTKITIVNNNYNN